MHLIILNFETLIILTPFLQSVKVVVFLELVVLLKLARMSLWFLILSSLRKREWDNSYYWEYSWYWKKHDNGNKNNTAAERLQGKFINDNTINLSGRNLSEAEISLLSKVLKFFLLDKAKFRRVLKKTMACVT